MTIELPTKKRPVSRDLGKQAIFLYGPPGVGKTTFANGFPETLFLATEEGQGFIECYHQAVGSWKDFCESVTELKGKGGKRFQTIAIDTVDMLWKHCMEYIGKKHGFEHPSDEDYGKGYELISDEFRRWINRLLSLGKGVIMISHSKDETVKTRVMEITKTMPTIPKSARKIVLPLASVIIYAGFRWKKNPKTGEKVEKRVAIMQPSETLEAKDRTGRFPRHPMPLRAHKFIEAFKRGSK